MYEDNVTQRKSYAFAIRIVNAYKYLVKHGELSCQNNYCAVVRLFVL